MGIFQQTGGLGVEWWGWLLLVACVVVPTVVGWYGLRDD